MSENKVKDHMLHMTLVTAEKESMVLLNLDLIITKDSRKDKKPSQDHMVEFYVQAVSNQESSEPFYSNK